MYFAKEVFKNNPNHRVTAVFNDGHEQTEYTSEILHLLVTDPIVEYIFDSETGEILFHR